MNEDTENQKAGETSEQVKSKSQVKREMLLLQQMGEKLVSLSMEQLKSIDIPDNLMEAVCSAKKLKSHGAKKRQLKFIGVLLRKIDSQPIRDAFYEIDRGRSVQAAAFHMIENIRDELIQGNDDLIEEILDRYPGTDRQVLRQLVRNARKELHENNPPKSSRALFRYIRQFCTVKKTE